MIRKANHHDYNTILQFAREMVSESIYPYATVNPDKVFDLFMADNVSFFLAQDDENQEPVGFICLIREPFFFSDELCARDLALFISKDKRGGPYAKELLQAAQRWAQGAGVKQLFIGQTVGHRVDATRRFYERAGFAIAGFNTVMNLGD